MSRRGHTWVRNGYGPFWRFMVEITLTKGKKALVDDEDYDWLNRWRWYYSQGYAVRSVNISGKRYTVGMHRLIMHAINEGMDVDHIDGNRLNNCWTNLRYADARQNAMNRGLYRTNTSGKKGVYWSKSKNKWESAIRCKGKRYHLGVFSDIDDAARAYNEAALKHFGEYARLNP